MPASVRIQVDGLDYEVAAGLTILQALDGLGVLNTPGGVQIPHYCWHPKLSIDGSCRLCQVETRQGDDDEPRCVVACSSPVKDGLIVDTKSAAVAAVREGVMELLLVNHPLDCPICDQAGECTLQDWAFEYGVPRARTREPRRALEKRVELGPTILLDQERCILCRRCVRFCREVTGTGELGVVGRGDRSVIETFPGASLDNPYSMNVADICPVGALTTRDFRFKMRVWFLEQADGICSGCARGCNVHLDVAKNEVQRYRPRRNDEVNGTWICDSGRLSYRDIARDDRLASCRVRREGELRPATRLEAVSEAAERLRPLLAAKGPGVVAGIASAHASNEDLRAFKTFLDVLDVESVGLALELGDSDALLQHAEKGANGSGARAVGFGELAPIVERVRRGGIEALVVLGHDAIGAAGFDGTDVLGGLDSVIVFDTHRSPLDRVAHVIFPVRHPAEKDASYTNCDGRVQSVRRAVVPGPEVLDEREFLAEIGAALGLQGYGLQGGLAGHALKSLGPEAAR